MNPNTLKTKRLYNCHNSTEHCFFIKASNSTIRHRNIRANLVGCQLYLQFGVIEKHMETVKIDPQGANV